MKKIITGALALFLAAGLSAYNPPAGGQNMYVLSSPLQLTSASSAAGGAIFYPGPYSAAFNPALPALEQRITLDAGFSVLAANNFNSALQTGILIPTKRFVASGMLQGVFLNSARISVGFNVTGGVIWGSDSDWLLNGDIGALYRRESLGFMKDFRVGVSVLNLGKTFTDKKLIGIKDKDKDILVNKHSVDSFPNFATVRAGAAALFVDNGIIKLGPSLDITTTAFQNVIFDAGFQFGIKDIVFLYVSESIDLSEAIAGYSNFMPAIGLGVKFDFKTKNNEYLKKHSWDASEMLVAAAWQQRYDSIQAVSAGAVIKLGQRDTDPPVITIWDGEE